MLAGHMFTLLPKLATKERQLEKTLQVAYCTQEKATQVALDAIQRLVEMAILMIIPQEDF